MKFLIFLVLMMIAASASAKDVRFKDCGSNLAKDVKISVDPCEAEPCSLKRGMNYSIGISFTPVSASKNVHVIIHGVVAGIPVTFPFDHPNACKDSGLACPLKSGVAVKYTATLPVLAVYPAIKLYVEWELRDPDAKKDLVCGEIPVAVVKANNNRREQKAVRMLQWEN